MYRYPIAILFILLFANINMENKVAHGAFFQPITLENAYIKGASDIRIERAQAAYECIKIETDSKTNTDSTNCEKYFLNKNGNYFRIHSKFPTDTSILNEYYRGYIDCYEYYQASKYFQGLENEAGTTGYRLRAYIDFVKNVEKE